MFERRVAGGRRRTSSVMKWSDTVVEAAAVISHRPVRTFLTALGTIVGVAAFVATTGIASTAEAQVSSTFDAMNATEVRVHDAAPDGTNPFPVDADQRLERLNGINAAGLSYVVTKGAGRSPSGMASRSIDATSRPVPVMAATPGALRAARVSVREGVLIDEFHQSRAERVAVVGSLAADEMGISRVDAQPAVFIGEIGYTVIGIIDDAQRNPDLLISVVIPTTTEQALIATENAEIELLIDTEPGAAALAGRQAPMALRPQDPERFSSLVPPDPTTLRNRVESDVTSLYYALAFLSLVVGTIAIANATLLNTIERRPEIGLRRALGARRSHIARQVMLEAAATGMVAGIVGTALAVLAIAAVASSRGWTATIDLNIVLLAPLIGLMTGAVAGMLPALSASNVPPAVTLRG